MLTSELDTIQKLNEAQITTLLFTGRREENGATCDCRPQNQRQLCSKEEASNKKHSLYPSSSFC